MPYLQSHEVVIWRQEAIFLFFNGNGSCKLINFAIFPTNTERSQKSYTVCLDELAVFFTYHQRVGVCVIVRPLMTHLSSFLEREMASFSTNFKGSEPQKDPKGITQKSRKFFSWEQLNSNFEFRVYELEIYFRCILGHFQYHYWLWWKMQFNFNESKVEKRVPLLCAFLFFSY